MKLIAIILFAACIQVSARGYSQITLSETNTPLQKVFQEIQKQSGYDFVSTYKTLKEAGNVTVNVLDVSLQKALDECLKGKSLTYVIIGKTVVIQSKEKDYYNTTDLIMPMTLLSPPIEIHGSIVNQQGEPLQNVSILISGTKIGTTTNNEGRFTVNAPNDIKNIVLEISSVGYQTKKIKFEGQNQINVTLELEVTGLSDVVVVGYGTQKRATLTGSISTVDSKSFEDKGTVANPLQALQGQVPGVIITRQSAAPGNEGWNIQIRGAASINPTDALIVIDGVPAAGMSTLNSINPTDIESMSFLKDASAAIYGARAAGGVVLVTTKKAKAGGTRIEYDGSFSDKLVGLQPRLMNVKQWAEGLVAARTNDGFDANDVWMKFGKLALENLGSYYDVKATGVNPIPSFSDVSDYVFFDNSWTDILWGNVGSTQNNLSLSGRGPTSGYRLSLGYMNDGSLLKWGNNSNKRYNIRLSNDFLLGSKVKVESNISFEKNNVVTPTMLNFVLGQYAQPGMPVKALNGMPYAWGGNLNPNSEAELGGDSRSNRGNLSINEKLTYDVSNKLKFVTILGYNTNNINLFEQQNTIQWYNYQGTIPGVVNPTPTATYFKRGTTSEDYYNANAYLEYKNTIKVNHDIGVTVGSQYERDEYDYYDATVYSTLSPDISDLLGTGNKFNTEKKNHYAIGSLFGRLNYAYKQKYLFEANLRYDGSSKFIAANRWKFFYGFSAGWRIDKEPFMERLKIFNTLKLRTSYGVVGNPAGIELYDYIQLLTIGSPSAVTSPNPLLGATQANVVGTGGKLVSLDRSWERIKNSNIALDFSILRGKLNGTVEFYEKDNSNMLLRQTFPSVLGASAPAANIGHLKTKGWEINLAWSNKVGELSYFVGGNITYNRNKLINLNGATTIVSGYNAATQGYPVGSVFGLEYAGTIQTKEQLTEYVNKFTDGNTIGLSNKLTQGDNMYKDINGDGKLTVSDYTYLGTDDPRYSYSFNFGMQWKGFDFSAIFQGVGSRTIFRNGNAWRIPFSSYWLNSTVQSVNNNWTPDNPNAFYPRYSTTGTINNYNYQASSHSVENGAYLRLKNVVIGYSIPDKVFNRVKFISKLRLYASGNDLWEITHIKDGWDPEAPSNITPTGQPYYGRYPFYRYLTFGLNLNF